MPVFLRAACLRNLPGPSRLAGGALLRAGSVRLDSSQTRFNEGAHVGETHLQCGLPGASIRVFLDRIDSSTEGAGYPEGLDTALLGAISRHLDAVEFATFAYTGFAHGRLGNVAANEFLERFTREAPRGPQPKK